MSQLSFTARQAQWGGFAPRPQLQPEPQAQPQAQPQPQAQSQPHLQLQPQISLEARIEHLLNEGLTHHQAGRSSAARQAYEQVLALVPMQADALNLLGVLCAQEGQPEAAIHLLTRAVAARPKDGDILNNLGRFLLETWRFEEARDPLERAVALQPHDVNARYNLAGVLRQLGEPERALELWTGVLAEDAHVRSTRMGIIEILSEQGRFEEAEQAARETIEAVPEVSAAYLCLARIRRFDADDDGFLQTIERRIPLAPTGADEALLRFAAGKVCEDLKLYDRAFEHFAAANGKAHGEFDVGRAETARRAQSWVFTEAFFRERQGWGFDSELPVFIVGMPRSGTSLVEQMLAAHPEVCGLGEITAFERAARLSGDISPTDEPYPLSVADLTRFGAEMLGRRYVTAVGRRAGARVRRITDKTPHNFEHLGLIALTLPKAKIIHCRRDPMDTCLSCWTTPFADPHAFNRSFADLGLYYWGYRKLMDHWRQVLPIEVLELDYEALVRTPEAEARRMLEFLRLDWAPQVLEFHQHRRSVRAPALWQVRQPLYASSVGRWRRYATHLDALHEALGPLAQGGS
jgi:tetratricopeptide (TPR) repeat protein